MSLEPAGEFSTFLYSFQWKWKLWEGKNGDLLLLFDWHFGNHLHLHTVCNYDVFYSYGSLFIEIESNGSLFSIESGKLILIFG